MQIFMTKLFVDVNATAATGNRSALNRASAQTLFSCPELRREEKKNKF